MLSVGCCQILNKVLLRTFLEVLTSANYISRRILYHMQKEISRYIFLESYSKWLSFYCLLLLLGCCCVKLHYENVSPVNRAARTYMFYFLDLLLMHSIPDFKLCLFSISKSTYHIICLSINSKFRNMYKNCFADITAIRRAKFSTLFLQELKLYAITSSTK